MTTDLKKFEMWSKVFSETVVPYSLRLLLALALITLAFVVSGWARRTTERALNRAHVEITLSKFIANFFRWFVLLLAGLAGLDALGVKTTGFAAVLGGASVAIGLAFNDTLSNLASGILLLLFRPFRVADTISVAGVTGRVAEIELFSTRIDAVDNRRFIVPNGTVFKAVLENVSYNQVRRVDITLSVPLNTDMARVQKILEDATAAVADLRQEPPVSVLAIGIGPGVQWQVAVWVPTSSVSKAKHELILAVKTGLDAAEIALV